jgi:chorismate mutase
MALCGIRGATTATLNTREAILAATRELLDALIRANQLHPADIVSAFFTTTPDLDAAFPAAAAREMGWTDIPLLDAQAPRISTDIARCIRVLIHWDTDCAREKLCHIYLHGASHLRPDWANRTAAPKEQS